MEHRIIVILFYISYSCAAPEFYVLAPSINAPEKFPGLGLTPRYHSLVYDYVNSMAGSYPPVEVKIVQPVRLEDFGVRGDPVLADEGDKEPVTEVPTGQAHSPSHLLPSDFILLTRTPQSQFFGNFDAVKNKKMKLGVDRSAMPPVGGVVSNYVLLRDNLHRADKVKRQTYYDEGENEGVVISASEPRADNSTSNTTDSESKEEAQPSVAQSKPSAIALAGRGGVAQAAPVGTAVVGVGGLAIAAPSGTAVAGQGTQGAIQLGGEEKMKRRWSSPQ